MNFLQQIDELESWIPKRAAINEKISKTTIGWQIAHTLKVANSVIKLLVKSDPKAYKWQFSIIRPLFLTMGYLPRGKAKAPKAVQPKEEEITVEEEYPLELKARRFIT